MNARQRLQNQVSEQFQKDVKDHKMKVLKDEGVYRHLVFKNPASGNYWFEIVTWPGRLAFAGDMDEFMFCRTEDMFEFFRGSRQIDYRYWAEKCQAGKVDTFDADVVIESAIDDLDHLDPRKAEKEEEIRDALSSASSEHEVFEAFDDAWGVEITDLQSRNYTYHFLWCCHALRWAIRMYDAHKQGAKIESPRPKIVCLCGSTRFMNAFREANLRETITGNIVLSVGCDTKSDADLIALGQLTQADKAALDKLHKRKIDLADEVLVLNVGGYIGESTRSEIEYATALGKPVRYLEESSHE